MGLACRSPISRSASLSIALKDMPMTRFLPALVAGFLMVGCGEAPHILSHQKPSKNIEDVREKPRTAVLVNGLFVYGKPGMMGAIEQALKARGWQVTILNHTDAKRLTHMPRVIIGHSMGANAILKRSAIFIRNHPDLIVSIDAGRAPLWHRAPESKARVVDISCPYHPIGGQEISGSDHKREICGTAHIAMPHDRRVIDIIVKEVEALK
jgi:hypothetical protein